MAYATKDGSEARRCKLVIQKIPMYQFMSMFRENLVYEYARHTHRARWLDTQFKLCKDTFPFGNIVSVVDFVENYTLQPQREVQSQYYNSTQVSIFVHIAFIHAADSTKDQRKVLREYHFLLVMITHILQSSCKIASRCSTIIWLRGAYHTINI